jgi:hypothetical protein
MDLTSWGALWYSTPPEIQVSQPPTGLNALATTADLKALQDAENAKNAAAYTDATVWNVPVPVLLQDAQEAVIGITSDLLGQSERKSLGDILTHGNRLRGLGVALIVLALLGMIFSWLLGGNKTVVVVD